MRRLFVSYDAIDAIAREHGLVPDLARLAEAQVRDICPWAAVVIDAEFGWWAFEDVRDADMWRNQA